jgi:methyl-accepting chemotaxis protein
MFIVFMLTLIPLVVVSVVTFIQFQKSIRITREESLKLAYADLDHIANGVYSMVEAQQDVLEQYVKSSLAVAREVLEKEGGASFIATETASWNAQNQFSKEFKQVTLPKMLVGGTWVGQTKEVRKSVPVVDKVQTLMNVTCTLFQRMDESGDMLRVATNVINQEGTRAIGTYIPATNPDGKPNPVVSAVLNGQTFIGRAFVVNKWYITSYEPIYDAENKIQGMLYTGVPQESATGLRQAIIDIQVGTTGYVYVLDSQGHYVISQGGKRDGENLWDSKDSSGNFFIRSIVETAQKLKGRQVGEQYYPWQNPGDPKPRYKVARLMYYQPWDWVIGVGSYEEEFLASPNKIQHMGRQSMTVLGIVILVFLLATPFIGLLTSRGIAGPIEEIAEVIRQIAHERDLTVEVPVRTQDEIGSMAAEFNNMVRQLKTSFGFVSGAAQNVDNQAGEVFKRATANRERAEIEEKRMMEIQGTVEDMGATAEEVNLAAQAQKDAAEKSAAGIQGLVKDMETIGSATHKQTEGATIVTDRVGAMGETGGKVVATAEKQSEQVVSVTDAVNRIAAAVEEMTRSAGQSLEYGKEVLQAATEGAQSVNATVEGMRAIAESSDQISEIISVITEIAEQTNLLALNAAIEAARAGAHGKGFAVVADEVGKLAQRSSEAAKEITQLIKDSSSRVTEGTNLTDQSQQALKRIADGGQVNMKAIEGISKTTSLLAQNTREVHAMMQGLNALAQDIRTMAGQQGARREAAQKALADLVQQSESIATLVVAANQTASGVVKEMGLIVNRTDRMEELASVQAKRFERLLEVTTESAMTAKQTVAGAGQVVGITEELRGLSSDLTEQVSQFKIADGRATPQSRAGRA